MAAAQTLAWALAANADLGMPPMMAASPSTWMPAAGWIRRQPVRRAPAGAVGDARKGCDGAGLLRRDHVGDRGLVAAKSVTKVRVEGSSQTSPCRPGSAHPFGIIEWLRQASEQAQLNGLGRILRPSPW